MRLPDAPLLEVVLELRWDVVVTDVSRVPIRFGYDPGFMPFQSAFDVIMSSRGFKSHQMMAEPGPTVPYAIVKRYRLADDQPFPLYGRARVGWK